MLKPREEKFTQLNTVFYLVARHSKFQDRGMKSVSATKHNK